MRSQVFPQAPVGQSHRQPKPGLHFYTSNIAQEFFLTPVYVFLVRSSIALALCAWGASSKRGSLYRCSVV